MTVYSDSIPSLHLSGKNLSNLEDIIKKDSTNIDFVFSFETNGFEYNLGSIEEFIQQPDLPDKSTKFQITMRCDEGRVKIDGKKRLSGGNLRISGEHDWVHKKKRQVTSELNKHNNLLRTYSSKIIWGTYALEILGWLVLSALSASSTGEVNVNKFETIIAVSVFIVLAGWPYALTYAIDLFYPYYLITKDESVQYRPRIKDLGKYVLVILTIIGSIGGVVTLLGLL